jgi:hypothetical protein
MGGGAACNLAIQETISAIGRQHNINVWIQEILLIGLMNFQLVFMPTARALQRQCCLYCIYRPDEI